MATAQEELAEAVVDAILEKIFQGRRDYLREQAYAVARKVAPQHPWDYLDRQIAEAQKIQKRLEDLIEYAEDEADLGCDHYYDPVVPTSKLKHLT